MSDNLYQWDDADGTVSALIVSSSLCVPTSVIRTRRHG
jgi:hypothetical protein